jgi:ketosteroid isomerase-like protein
MTDEEKIALVQAFNACIGKHDLDGLAKLITDDHVFIDSAHNVVSGRENVLRAWEGFLILFPDYKNVFETIRAEDDHIVILGHSTCSEAALDGPAIWTAKIADGAISEWRVYEDTDETRTMLMLTN